MELEQAREVKRSELEKATKTKREAEKLLSEINRIKCKLPIVKQKDKCDINNDHKYLAKYKDRLHNHLESKKKPPKLKSTRLEINDIPSDQNTTISDKDTMKKILYKKNILKHLDTPDDIVKSLFKMMNN